ncbi:hypothetical protein J4H92_07295 [Leucobacter weissii]|uniref:Uncharacterized protein n=1 Tax=Leucobacter weissii TaxID=1983706 RepID=A0A939MIV8_9MICO|nr:hypothetical protein [Leucobacter weissii]MBO1901754.1 hypothetical protein [Leucobacter weissii]
MYLQELGTGQLVEFAGLLVTLMIFFSIDAKYRFSRTGGTARILFHGASIVGGIATAVGLVVVWIEMFLPEEDRTIHLLMYFVPASVSVLAALVLAVEVIFLRRDQSERESDD